MPALHFVLLGALLFAARSVLPASGGDGRRALLVFSAAEVERLAADFTAQGGMAPGRDQLAALVEQAVDEQILDREARRLALDSGDRAIRQWLARKMRAVGDDPTLTEAVLVRTAVDLGLDRDEVIRRHLRQKMRLVLASDVGAETFSEEELEAALERHRERFLQPATFSFTQVFLSARVHGERLDERFAALLPEVRSLAPAAAAGLSDPFPLALQMTGSSQDAIARRFGTDFAAAVAGLSPGRWSEPIASPFGRHLAWVNERGEAGLPPLAEVRDRVARILAEERRLARVREGLERLRQHYEIRVEWPLELAGGAPAVRAEVAS